MIKKTYSISELAGEFDITTRTIRFYEEKGLLSPEREGTVRRYSNADRTKLKLILRGKRLGFSLTESLDIINMYNPAKSNDEQLQKLISTIREKRAQLQRQLNDLEAMLLDLDESETKCLEALKHNDNQNTDH